MPNKKWPRHLKEFLSKTPKGKVFDKAPRRDSSKNDQVSLFTKNDLGQLFTKNDLGLFFVKNDLGLFFTKNDLGT